MGSHPRRLQPTLNIRVVLPSRLCFEGADGASPVSQVVQNTYPAGLGEPLNIVVSAKSDRDALTKERFRDWLESVGFGIQCVDVSLGSLQGTDLGDGNGATRAEYIDGGTRA